jgi:Zn/Cd-binding protein ZinT
VEFVSAKIDEQTWEQISAKLKDVEALKVLREVVNYATERLKSKIDEVKSSKDVIAFFSKGKEFLTINVTRTNLRIYFQPSSGALFSKDEKFTVEKVSIWEGSFQKASGKYRAMTAWVSKETHLPAIKKLIDRIPGSR